MRISDWSSDVCSSDLLPPERRQSTLLESVHRPGEVIVEEMGEPRHAEARGVEFVKVGELAFEDVQPFDAEHRADGHRPAAARGEQGDRKSTRLNSSH